MEGTPATLSSGTTAGPSASVDAIVASVGRLLMDYALQLRDDVGGLATSGAAHVHGEADSSSGPTDTAREAAEGEEAPQLTESDVAECRVRLQRLQRVLRLLRAHSKGQSSNNGVGRGGSAGWTARHTPAVEDANQEAEAFACDCTNTFRRNEVLTTVLSRLERMTRRFQGLSSRATPAVQASSGALHSIQPLLSPVSLSDGALTAFSRNVGVVFRRRPVTTTFSAQQTQGHTASAKRSREEEEEAETLPNFWAQLSAQQRKARFSLYTLRSALLPRVDRLCAPLYVSPAVRELAQLNLAAEHAMLERTWCVMTKAHLLREVPSVAQDVELFQQTLRDALKSLPPSQQEALVRDIRYVAFVATDSGVVRVGLQHALFMDLTYDVKRGHWRVLSLHWNLYTSPAGASLVSPSLTRPTAPPPPRSSASSPSVASHYEQLQPENTDAHVAFLQNALQQGGLSDGFRAAQRLVCAVVLDALALQLQRLQQNFFTGGGLARVADIEVRPGTFISFHLSLSALLGADAGGDGAETVHVKMAVTSNTVMMERVRGTELSTRKVTPLLGASSLVPHWVAEAGSGSGAGGGGPPPRIVLDMEALLWRCLVGDT